MIGFGDKFMRPKARFKLGGRYLGKKHSLTARGYVIFKEYDQRDRKHYYWEEWELTGFNDYDTWVEYDHYSRKVTLYEPVRVPEKYDVQSLVRNSPIVMTINRMTVNGTVKEVGTGTVVKLRGKMSYQLFSDDVIHYAEVKTGPTTVVSIEDYRQTGDTDFDYYVGRRLSKGEQKIIFGKVIAPFNIKWSTILYSILFLGFFIWSLIPQYRTVCTPRTAPSSSTTSSQAIPNSQPQQDCQRVRVYSDGGGGGVGK